MTTTNERIIGTADLLSESDRVLQDLAQFMRNPANFGFDVPIEAENYRIKMAAKISLQLQRNRAYAQG